MNEKEKKPRTREEAIARFMAQPSVFDRMYAGKTPEEIERMQWEMGDVEGRFPQMLGPKGPTIMDLRPHLPEDLPDRDVFKFEHAELTEQGFEVLVASYTSPSSGELRYVLHTRDFGQLDARDVHEVKSILDGMRAGLYKTAHLRSKKEGD